MAPQAMLPYSNVTRIRGMGLRLVSVFTGGIIEVDGGHEQQMMTVYNSRGRFLHAVWRMNANVG